MFSLDLMPLTRQNDLVELSDPRGGRVVNTDQSLQANNLHVQYFAHAWKTLAAALDPQGRPTQYMQTLPGLNSASSNLALAAVFQALHTKEMGPGGYNAQIGYHPPEFGVTL